MLIFQLALVTLSIYHRAEVLGMQRQRQGQRQPGYQRQQQCGNQAAGVQGVGGVGGRHKRLSQVGTGRAGISIRR